MKSQCMSSGELHFSWRTGSGRTGAGGAPEARFPYWSFTKTVWAILALQLVEAGRLDLDEEARDGRHRLRHLLSHRTGLPDYTHLPAYHEAVAAGAPVWSRAEMLDRALAAGMLFAPGQGWSYSNIGYMFLRERIEEAAGQPIDDLARDRIFSPLGLGSIALARELTDFAPLHWPAAARYDPGWVFHGCLTGNAEDAVRLLHHLFAGDLLSPGMLAKMLETIRLGGPIPGRPWTLCGYALGLMAGEIGPLGRAIGHSGRGPFSVNAVYHFPDRPDPVTIACFTDGADEAVAETAAVEIAGRI